MRTKCVCSHWLSPYHASVITPLLTGVVPLTTAALQVGLIVQRAFAARLQPTEVVVRAATLVAMATRVHAILAGDVVMAADLSDVVAATRRATWRAAPLYMTSLTGNVGQHRDATLAAKSVFICITVQFGDAININLVCFASPVNTPGIVTSHWER